MDADSDRARLQARRAAVLERLGVRADRARQVRRRWLVLSIVMALAVGTLAGVGDRRAAEAAPVGSGFELDARDLRFIFQQIQIAERHVDDGTPCPSSALVPEPRLPFGLRTVDGSCNHLLPGTTEFGASDNLFPRLAAPVFRPADGWDPDGGGPAPGVPTSYAQTSGVVADFDPRLVSNLVVDQSPNNPAAVAASDGCAELDGTTCFTGNVAPDAGLSAPFNSMFTFFGQFFDHGLDLVNKGGSGTVFIPLSSDDELYDPDLDGPDDTPGTADDAFNFLTLTRATNLPGADGVLGTPDDVMEDTNQTTPFVDQNQTYTSHPAHQVFLRDYVLEGGRPVATGRLIDGQIEGNIGSWHDVKTQARDLLGIDLTDADVGNVPLVVTDAYGNFLPGPNGFPQVMFPGNGVTEGDPANPIDISTALRTGHAFLDDIAHNAAPNGRGGPLAPDGDGDINPTFESDGTTPALRPDGTYDDELLDAHFVTGDGRGNENIGLTAVHTIFHAEHNRLADQIDGLITTLLTPAEQDAWRAFDAGSGFDYGERLFQAARFVTEMQYQHLVFEEFARTISPSINAFMPDGINFSPQINPAISAEFAHAVYRFGHSMLNESIARMDPVTGEHYDMTLFEGFLNPTAFNADPNGGTWTAAEAAGVIFQGSSRQVGNEIDEFVTDVLRNRLVGRPLDLATLNLARGRSEGIPPLNSVRRELYARYGHASLVPYDDWRELGFELRNPESLVNFVAAYGTHPMITTSPGPNGEPAGSIAARRAAAAAIVDAARYPGPITNPADPDGMGDDPATFIDESLDDDLGPDGIADADPATGDDGAGPDGHKGDDPLTGDESLDDDLGPDGIADPDPATGDDGSGTDGVKGDDPATFIDESLDDDLGPDGIADADPATGDDGAGLDGVKGDDLLTPDDESLDDDLGPDGIAGTADDGSGTDGVKGDDPATFIDESLDDDLGPDTIAGTADDGAGADLHKGDDPTTAVDESLDDIVPPADRDAFMTGTGSWDGMATGLEDVDLWVGGLAERPQPFGGMLGSTFNFVFETQLEDLQNGDRFYYLERLDGLNLLTQLEGNSFSELVMRNSTAEALPATLFARPTFVFRIGPSNNVLDDPSTPENEATMVVYQSSGTIRYNGLEHVIWDGSPNNDRITSSEGDDTIRGNDGNDRIQGGAGNDQPFGGDGDDIITDSFGDDVMKGGPGHDVITGGPGLDLLQGNSGDDFIVAGNDFTETFGGAGDDVMFTGDSFTEAFAGAGDDWMEGGPQLDLLVGDENNQFQDDPGGGHDVIIGGLGDDDYDAEGGDDIMVADVPGTERLEGMLGFDWVTYRDEPLPVDADMRIPVAQIPAVGELRDRFDRTEAISGYDEDDVLRGDDRGCTTADAAAGVCLDALAEGTVVGHELTQDGIDRIDGLRPFLDAALPGGVPIDPTFVWDDGNILLGGNGNDELEGRGADDLIDGDRWLNVQLRAPDPSTADPNDTKLVTSLKALQADVVAGRINPGSIEIVRTIVAPAAPGDCDTSTPVNCDTAVFSGPVDDYDIVVDGDVVRITHARGDAVNGTDTLLNIEQLLFTGDPTDPADDELVVLGALPTFTVDAAADFGTRAIGALAVTQLLQLQNTGTVPLEGVTATVGGADADSFSASAVGCGTVAVGASCLVSASFSPAGAGALTATLAVSIDGGVPVAIELIGTGVANTPADGEPTIDDLTPVEGSPLTVDTSAITDPDGIGTPTVQWQRVVGGAPSDIVGANGPTYTPTQLEVGSTIRVEVSFVDGFGTLETVVSDPTGIVGDLFIGTAAANTFNGTAAGDIASGGGGADTLLMNGGDDVADGGAGNDTINGGAGNDLITFTGTANGNDAVTGGNGTDTIRALGAGNTNIGLSTFATIEVIEAELDAPTVQIVGTAAANTWNFRNITLTRIDAIDGAGGADTITGSAAADVIIGGAGNDVLDGDAGNDTFRYLAAFGADTINGFDAAPAGGQDLINVPVGATVTFAAINGGRDTRVTVRLGATTLGTITVNRVTTAALTSADITFG